MLIRGTEGTVVLILVKDITPVAVIILPTVVIDTVLLDHTVVVVPMIEEGPVIVIVIHPTDHDLAHTPLQIVVAAVIVHTIQHPLMDILHQILPMVRIIRVINQLTHVDMKVHIPDVMEGVQNPLQENI